MSPEAVNMGTSKSTEMGGRDQAFLTVVALNCASAVNVCVVFP